MNIMTSYRARVRNGRLTLDVATDLPEGSELELQPVADDLADLGEDEKRLLLKDIAAGDADERAGRYEDADEVLRRLRQA